MDNIKILENASIRLFDGVWFLGNPEGKNAMCLRGAYDHGVTDKWVGTVELSLTQFDHGQGHRVGYSYSDCSGTTITLGGTKEHRGNTRWLRKSLMALSDNQREKITEFYIAFKNVDGTYIPCPWKE